MAAAIIVSLVAVALLVAAAERADFARAAELVRTQEQKVGVLVQMDYRGRFRTDYIIEVDGHDRTLSYSEFITNETLGAAVPVVVDPENESRVIAVGSPGDWEEKPFGVGITLAVVILALVIGGLAGSRIIPEDFAAISGRTSGTPRKRRIPHGKADAPKD
ncbi:hypothetical protein ACFVTE_16905 [Arthrobacter sp. NPDC058097]|uniref:hypothetical protein n=1 Tax=Arthrobacter sp. NPDC058097 TaxID=3346340 RepID=UPI0036D8B33E